MPVAPWPEWLPDQADYANPGSPIMKNVVPLTAKSYGAMSTFTPYSDNTLTERCQGSYSIKDQTGIVHHYAGDRQKLYQIPLGTRTLTDSSRTVGGVYVTNPKGFWSMTSFGNRMIATNGVDPIQSLLVGDPNFALLAAGVVDTARSVDQSVRPMANNAWFNSLNNTGYANSPAGNVTMPGTLNCTGYVVRAGSGAALVNAAVHNINWTGSVAQLWIDSTNAGNITLTCDYRIKDNVTDLPSTWDAVKALRPISYTYKAHPELLVTEADPQERWGFLAHELQEALLPTAATGVKDEPNLIQSPDMMAVTASLARALQEAMAGSSTWKQR